MVTRQSYLDTAITIGYRYALFYPMFPEKAETYAKDNLVSRVIHQFSR
jgi:hypothetical protein